MNSFLLLWFQRQLIFAVKSPWRSDSEMSFEFAIKMDVRVRMVRSSDFNVCCWCPFSGFSDFRAKQGQNVGFSILRNNLTVRWVNCFLNDCFLQFQKTRTAIFDLLVDWMSKDPKSSPSYRHHLDLYYQCTCLEYGCVCVCVCSFVAKFFYLLRP